MNRSSGFRNKLIYLAVIIVMLLPLFYLGQPTTGRPGDVTGTLTQMRTDLNLAEASLGEIDPASSSMKLAMLGMRGPAATFLWKKSEDYRVLHEWDRLSATLNQIANLQPHYEKVWEHQAHNLSYNVSLEFDDYRQRYSWVKKGTEYLTEGVRKNRTAPRLIWYTGWFYGNKLGMSDEKVQFRELFREDEPFHESLLQEGIAVDSPEAKGPDGRPDNWLVGRLWLKRGYALVDSGTVPLVDKSPVTFFELGPKWRIQHASAIEDEGVLDDRSKGAWERAADDWYGYGTRTISTTEGVPVQLGTISDLYQRKVELTEQFEQLVGETLNRMRDEQFENLTSEQREALATPDRERTREQLIMAAEAEMIAQPSLPAVAKASDPDVRLKAIQLAAQIEEVNNRIDKTNIYRDQMNYGYWELRCRAEQDDLVIDARRLLYEAQQMYEETDLDGEIAKYEQAFAKWEQVFDKYPGLILDVASDEVTDAINRYRVATDQAELPDDFPLKTFYEMRTESELSTPEEYERRRGGSGLPDIDITRPYTGAGAANGGAPVVGTEVQSGGADESGGGGQPGAANPDSDEEAPSADNSSAGEEAAATESDEAATTDAPPAETSAPAATDAPAEGGSTSNDGTTAENDAPAEKDASAENAEQSDGTNG